MVGVLIKPSRRLLDFLATIPEDCGAPKSLYEAASASPESVTVSNADLKWIAGYIRKEKGKFYLYEMMEGCHVLLPSPPGPGPRNPELQERIERLRKQLERKQYDQMVMNVTRTGPQLDEETFASEMKQMNSQLIEVFGFFVTMAAAFAFGFFGINYMIGPLDLGLRSILGVVIALVVAIAELYFMARVLGDYEFFHYQQAGKKKKNS